MVCPERICQKQGAESCEFRGGFGRGQDSTRASEQTERSGAIVCGGRFSISSEKKLSLIAAEDKGRSGMSSIGVSCIVFACLSAGSILGMILRANLPKHHLSDDSKTSVQLGMALISTMSALVLGLLVSSAKSSYDTQSAELTATSAQVLLLDSVLSRYGAEAQDARALLRGTVETALTTMWSTQRRSQARLGAPSHSSEKIFDKIQDLSPKDENQRTLKAQALSILEGIRQMRWLQYEQQTNSVPIPLLVILVSWLTMLFIGLGIFAPANGTVITSLAVSQLAVSAAILLILEFYTPYGGLIEVSSAPLRAALEQLG